MDCSHFWGGKAFRDHQWRSEGELQREFLLRALRGIWQVLSNSRAAVKWVTASACADRCTACCPAQVEILNGLLRVPTATVVMRQLAVVLVEIGRDRASSIACAVCS